MVSKTNLEELTKPFPENCLKTRKGGGNSTLTYIPGHLIIRRLNEATGNDWTFCVVSETETPQPDGKILIKVRVALTIPGHGTREGIGVQIVSEKGGEDLYKGALTDAVKKAATFFGVGLELYGPDLEAEAEAQMVMTEEEAKAEANKFINRAKKLGYPVPDITAARQLFFLCVNVARYPAAGSRWDDAEALYAVAYDKLEDIVRHYLAEQETAKA